MQLPISSLPLRRILDPRPAVEALARPFRGAVNIPMDELAGRVYELPAKGSEVQVIGGEAEMIDALGMLGIAGIPVEGIPILKVEAGRLWSPNSFVEEILPSLQPGRAIDLGCGAGRDAVFMASLGWRVTAVDHLPDAIQRAKLLESRHRTPEMTPIAWITAKVADMPLEPECLDLILSCFAFDEGSLNRIACSLKPGGHLLVETFSPVHREKFGKPSALQTISLASLDSLPGLDLVSGDENWRGDRCTTRALLRLP